MDPTSFGLAPPGLTLDQARSVVPDLCTRREHCSGAELLEVESQAKGVCCCCRSGGTCVDSLAHRPSGGAFAATKRLMTARAPEEAP